jgi:hypothetical protein
LQEGRIHARFSPNPMRPFAQESSERSRDSPVVLAGKEFRQPVAGFFSWVTLAPHYESRKLPLALCVEFAAKYEAAVTLQVRPSPRQSQAISNIVGLMLAACMRNATSRSATVA